MCLTGVSRVEEWTAVDCV